MTTLNIPFHSMIRYVSFIFVLVLAVLSLPSFSSADGDGLTGHYYQGYSKVDGYISFDGLTEKFSRVDANIDFWNRSRYYRWEPVAGYGNNYSVEWTGYIYIETAGQYGFGTMSDDGSEIWIDGTRIVDNGESQWYDWEDNISEGDTSGETFPDLILSQGYHEISVAFYEKASYDGIELWWLLPSAGESDIPYYGTTFHGTAPTYNSNTNWNIVPQAVLYTSLPVVPEPISSILFIVGGATLGFRRFRKNLKK